MRSNVKYDKSMHDKAKSQSGGLLTIDVLGKYCKSESITMQRHLTQEETSEFLGMMLEWIKSRNALPKLPKPEVEEKQSS